MERFAHSVTAISVVLHRNIEHDALVADLADVLCADLLERVALGREHGAAGLVADVEAAVVREQQQLAEVRDERGARDDALGDGRARAAAAVSTVPPSARCEAMIAGMTSVSTCKLGRLAELVPDGVLVDDDAVVQHDDLLAQHGLVVAGAVGHEAAVAEEEVAERRDALQEPVDRVVGAVGVVRVGAADDHAARVAAALLRVLHEDLGRRGVEGHPGRCSQRFRTRVSSPILEEGPFAGRDVRRLEIASRSIMPCIDQLDAWEAACAGREAQTHRLADDPVGDAGPLLGR